MQCNDMKIHVQLSPLQLFVYISPGSDFFFLNYGIIMGLPGGSDGKESACNTGDLGSIPEP